MGKIVSIFDIHIHVIPTFKLKHFVLLLEYKLYLLDIMYATSTLNKHALSC